MNKIKEVWIIGGGSSFPEQFQVPAELIADVRTGTKPISAFNPYLKSLRKCKTIAVNSAYKLGNWVSYVFFADEDFWQANRIALESMKAPLHSCNSRFFDNPHKKVTAWEKDRMKRQGITEKPNAVSWNMNSGCAAINLAVQLEFKRIYLLGFDMNPNQSTHFHPHHPWNADKLPPFYLHMKGMDEIKKDADRLGIEIINCSPNSTITQFPKQEVKNILTLK